MTINELKKMLDQMSKKLPSGGNTIIDFCHHYGFEKIQKGHLFNYYIPKENRIKFISSYYYFEILSDNLKHIERYSTLDKAIKFASDVLKLKDFIIVYKRGNTSTVEAYFENGFSVSEKQWYSKNNY